MSSARIVSSMPATPRPPARHASSMRCTCSASVWASCRRRAFIVSFSSSCSGIDFTSTCTISKHLAEKVIDIVQVDVKSMPEHELLKETMNALRRQDAQTDAEQVQRMLDTWRAGGLGV